MIKKSKGITLVSLTITIVLMLIIASITVSVSMDRFEINDYNKMINDLELLEDKVSNYYLKYNAIPVVRNDENDPIIYSYTEISFNTNKNDNDVYYILDLEAMEGIALNYGETGFKNPNSSDDVYIINEKSHQIYYVKGVELKDNVYHTIVDNNTISDNIPPSKPEIKIVSGKLNNAKTEYVTEVQLEIVPGKDNWSGTDKTTYSYIFTDVDNISTTTTGEIEESKIITLTENGTYEITVNTSDVAGNTSEDVKENININIPAEVSNEISNTIE